MVGDDDQSLYRFRGATVQLFSDFAQRYQTGFGNDPTPVFLSNNYRSSRNIVEVVNSYSSLDAGYQTVRVASKPQLKLAPSAASGTPILGMFRNTIEELATDLARFIYDVFRGAGASISEDSTIVSASDGGAVGDCALLCSSLAELAANDRARLPLLLPGFERCRKI